MVVLTLFPGQESLSVPWMKGTWNRFQGHSLIDMSKYPDASQLSLRHLCVFDPKAAGKSVIEIRRGGSKKQCQFLCSPLNSICCLLYYLDSKTIAKIVFLQVSGCILFFFTNTRQLLSLHPRQQIFNIVIKFMQIASHLTLEFILETHSLSILNCS